MKTWTWPVSQLDGWRFLVSPNRTKAIGGDNVTTCVDLLSGALTPLFPGAHSRVVCWLTDSTALVAQYEQDCNLYRYYAPTDTWLDPIGKPYLSHQWIAKTGGAGGDGHWIGGYPDVPNRVTYDGKMLDAAPPDWCCGAGGDWAVIAAEKRDSAGMVVNGWTTLSAYLRGIFQRTLDVNVVRDPQVNVRFGLCGIGRGGRPHICNLVTGEAVDVTVTPWGVECTPVFDTDADGKLWVCTTSERNGNAVLIRRYGSQDCIQIPLPQLPNVIGCHMAVTGMLATVAAWANSGQVVILHDIDLTQPTSAVEPLPVGPEMRDPKGLVIVTPMAGACPLSIASHLVLLDGTGAIQATRHYAQHVGSGRFIKANADRAAAMDAAVALDAQGVWEAFVRMQGLNGAVVDTPRVRVDVSAEVETPIEPRPVDPPIVVPPAGYVDPPFHQGLQAVFAGEPIGVPLLNALIDRRVTLCRADIQTGDPNQIIAEALAVQDRMRTFYLCGVPQLSIVPEGSWCVLWTNAQVGGKGGKATPQQYAQQACLALDIARRRGLRVFIGQMDNLNNAWLGWLDQMIAAMGSRWAEVQQAACNWYPDGPGQSENGHDGRTRAGDFDQLTQRIGTRPFIVPETGFHTARLTENTGFLGKGRKYWQLSEPDQLARAQRMDQFLRSRPGCVGMVWYQLNDGPGTGYMDHYGWRHVDGTWKPVSTLWT